MASTSASNLLEETELEECVEALKLKDLGPALKAGDKDNELVSLLRDDAGPMQVQTKGLTHRFDSPAYLDYIILNLERGNASNLIFEVLDPVKGGYRRIKGFQKNKKGWPFVFVSSPWIKSWTRNSRSDTLSPWQWAAAKRRSKKASSSPPSTSPARRATLSTSA